MKGGDQWVQGVTLIELLVAMVIIAIGVLGVAGIQALSLKQARDAGQKMMALQAANDLIDRIRINQEAVYAWESSDSVTADAAVNCLIESCSSTELAAYDLVSWRCRLGSENAICNTSYGLTATDYDQLPNARGSVTRVVSGGSIAYTVAVQWATSDQADQQVSVSARVQ